jgi:uncharacterized protein with ATP-grasp and redox domains
MTIAGHNNPPAFDAHSMHIEDLFALISDTTDGAAVDTDEKEAALDGLLDDVRKAKKAADAERAAEKKPHDDAAKAVQAKWKPLIDRCDMAADVIKRLLTPYRDAKQKAKDAAATKAREEVAAKEAAARAALQSSDNLEQRFEAEAGLKQATKLTAVANKLDRSATGLRTYWTHRIVNRRDLLKHVIERYPEDLADMLNEFVRAKVASGTRDMPGVEITSERRAA